MACFKLWMWTGLIFCFRLFSFMTVISDHSSHVMPFRVPLAPPDPRTKAANAQTTIIVSERGALECLDIHLALLLYSTLSIHPTEAITRHIRNLTRRFRLLLFFPPSRQWRHGL